MASSNSSFSTTSSSSTSNRNNRATLFSSPSLQELAAKQLINQFDSVQAIEEFLSESSKNHYADIRPLIEKHLTELKAVVSLFQYCVIRGEQKEAEDILKHVMKQKNRALLLQLLSSKGWVLDYSGRRIEGTALQMALGAGDVNFGAPCELLQVSSPVTKDNLNNLPINKKTAYVRYANQLFYVDKANKECTEIKLDQAVLELFDGEFRPTTKSQILSVDQQNNITILTGHIHEENMAEMIQRHLSALEDGEALIKEQITEQFPEGWEQKEKEREQRDKDALHEVISAIANSNTDKDCASALQKFRYYLEYMKNEVIKTGKHFNHQLLVEAFKMYGEKYNDFGGLDSRKNNLFWREVIGFIERYLPSCDEQAFCQHTYYIVEDGEKLKRSLKFRVDSDLFFPLDFNPTFRWGNDYLMGRWLEVAAVGGWGRGRLQTLCQAKTSNLQNLCSHTQQRKLGV
jgi:hypothetical protein